MRIVLLALLLALTVDAQHGGFSVDEQGRVWFVTDLAPRNSDAGEKSRLYIADASGFKVEAEAATYTDGMRAIVLPAVSSDGTRVAWTERAIFPTIAGRTRPTEYVGSVVRHGRYSEGPVVRPGFAGISRNGEWALWANPAANGLGSVWLNSSTGEEIPLPGVMLSVETVAADGSAVRPLEDRVEVHRPAGAVDRIPAGFISTQALISADTRRLLINSARALYLYDRDLSEWTTLAGDCGYCSIRALSPDGTRIAFVGDSLQRAITLVDTRDGTERTIPMSDDRVESLQFSDDGSALWVMTSGLELLRIDVASGEWSVTMPPTPVLRRLPKYAAPGARFRIDGDGLAGAAVSVRGRRLEITDRGPGWLQAMLPVDLPPGPAQWTVDGPGARFEAGPVPMEIVRQLPQFLELRDLGESDPVWMPRPVAFGASDGWLINPERPALPGEELLLSMTGLNEDTGALQWSIRPFADNGLGRGLSIDGVEPDPSRPGWWIVRLRLPADTPPGDTYVFCWTDELPHEIGYALLPVNSGGSVRSESSR